MKALAVKFTFQQLYFQENKHGVNHTVGKEGPRACLDAIRHSQNWNADRPVLNVILI
jgi:hypothetical protein